MSQRLAIKHAEHSVIMRVMPAFPAERGKCGVQLDAPTRQRLHAALGAQLQVQAVACPVAQELWLRVDDALPLQGAALDFFGAVGRWPTAQHGPAAPA